MELYYRIKGEGEPVILLHGLFGSLDNLGMIARGLEGTYRVISIDLRNHGRSPHVKGMDYPALASDVIAVLDSLGIDSAHFYGHSMGGKTAMQIALMWPERVKSLIVGDIAPVSYPHRHTRIFEGMRKVESQKPATRQEAEAVLSFYVGEPDVRSFLLTNLRRDAQGGFVWRLGLDAIENDYDNIVQGIDGTPYKGNVLFIKGGNSDYILNDYRDRILALFPNAKVRIVEGAGHWFHAEKTNVTLRIIRRFLDTVSS